MNFLEIFNRIPEFSWNKLKEENKKSFELGYKVGKREALDYLTDKQKYECRTLCDFEKAIVIQFLEERNLEFGYNVLDGGFYILKRKK